MSWDGGWDGESIDDGSVSPYHDVRIMADRSMNGKVLQCEAVATQDYLAPINSVAQQLLSIKCKHIQ